MKMTEGPPTPKKIKVDQEDLESLSKEDLIEKLKEQEKYIKILEDKQRGKFTDTGADDVEMRESDEKLKQQHIEAARRENTLVLRLTTKEQELQEYLTQIQDFKQAQMPSASQLRSMLLDPAINLVFQHMSKEMKECKERQKQTQNELSAWKFTPNSQTGKRLMAKCRMLLQENEDLGKVIASGRTAKLEGEIALEKTLVQEMKKSQAELDEFLGEIDEDVEGMQSMIYVLQQQLKETKEQVVQLKEENRQLKISDTLCRKMVRTSSPSRAPGESPPPAAAAATAELPQSLHTVTTALLKSPLHTDSAPTEQHSDTVLSQSFTTQEAVILENNTSANNHFHTSDNNNSFYGSTDASNDGWSPQHQHLSDTAEEAAKLGKKAFLKNGTGSLSEEEK